MTKIAEVEAKDYEGTNRRWTIYLVFSSGASQTVFGHGKYNLYFQAEKTQQEIEEQVYSNPTLDFGIDKFVLFRH